MVLLGLNPNGGREHPQEDAPGCHAPLCPTHKCLDALTVAWLVESRNILTMGPRCPPHLPARTGHNPVLWRRRDCAGELEYFHGRGG